MNVSCKRVELYQNLSLWPCEAEDGPCWRPSGDGHLGTAFDGDSLCDPYGFGEEVVSPIDVEADGEMVGTLPALFEVLPDAIEMVVP